MRADRRTDSQTRSSQCSTPIPGGGVIKDPYNSTREAEFRRRPRPSRTLTNVSICGDLKVTQITIPDYYFSTAQDERRARRSGIVSIAGKSVCLDCPVIAHATNDRLYFDIIPRRVDDDCLGPRPLDAKSRCRSPPPRVGRVVEPWISQY